MYVRLLSYYVCFLSIIGEAINCLLHMSMQLRHTHSLRGHNWMHFGIGHIVLLH